jgi:hypothetical protein
MGIERRMMDGGLRLIDTDASAPASWIDVMEITVTGDIIDVENLGLLLSRGKRLLARVQQAIVARQAQFLVAARQVSGPSRPAQNAMCLSRVDI